MSKELNFKTRFIPYGFVKIQNTPFSLWNDLKIIEEKDEFANFFNHNKHLICEYIGKRDAKKLLEQHNLTWSSIIYLYGLISSKILRGGGSNLTTWSFWCYGGADDIFELRKIIDQEQTLNLQNRVSFKLSPYVLYIGGKYYKNLKHASESIHGFVAENAEEYILNDPKIDLDEMDKLIKIQNNAKFLSGDSKLKICGKVDFTVSKKLDDYFFYPIDVNDLHGGLFWIDEFSRFYRKYSKKIIKPQNSILYYFANSFIDYFKYTTGKYPINILICLDDFERWNQDNGLNYIMIKNEALRILKVNNIKANIFFSYLEDYQKCMVNFKDNHKIKIRVLNEDDGSQSNEYQEKIDMVVRIYRKFYDTTNKYTTTRNFLGDMPPFIIYDPEEIRPAYYKENVHKIFRNIFLRETLDDSIILPSIIGEYNLRENSLSAKIFNDVRNSGNNDFVFKLNEKTQYTGLSAHFFSANNKLHEVFLQKLIDKMAKNIKDIDTVIVEPHYGAGLFEQNKKIEIRTINVQDSGR